MHPSGDYSSSKNSAVSSELASLYATYALILCTVPTFGAAALIGLVRLWGRPLPQDALERSHFIFQKRTLMASLIAIVAGGLMIIINVGVFVLFVMAVWTIIRGSLGLRTLLQGQPISHPLRLFY